MVVYSRPPHNPRLSKRIQTLWHRLVLHLYVPVCIQRSIPTSRVESWNQQKKNGPHSCPWQHTTSKPKPRLCSTLKKLSPLCHATLSHMLEVPPHPFVWRFHCKGFDRYAFLFIFNSLYLTWSFILNRLHLLLSSITGCYSRFPSRSVRSLLCLQWRQR